MIYRLHVAGNVICDCEGMAPSYKKSILKGLHDLMDDMPMYLKAIALKKALDGCFLTLSRSSVILTREHVLTRLNELRAVETKCSGDPIRACIENVAKASGMEVTEGLLDYFDDETHGFAAAVAARMMELTPDRVYMEANAEKKFEGGGSVLYACQCSFIIKYKRGKSHGTVPVSFLFLIPSLFLWLFTMQVKASPVQSTCGIVQ